MKWTIDDSTGDITVNLDTQPVDASTLHVRKYYTTSYEGNKRRDFRFLNLDDPCTEGIAQDGNCLNLRVFWKFEDLSPVAGSNGLTYVAHHDTPTDGTFAAFFIDVKYTKDPLDNSEIKGPRLVDMWPEFIPRDAPGQLEFTSEVSIVPNTFPFADCSGSGCAGVLL